MTRIATLRFPTSRTRDDSLLSLIQAAESGEPDEPKSLRGDLLKLVRRRIYSVRFGRSTHLLDFKEVAQSMGIVDMDRVVVVQVELQDCLMTC